MLETFKARLKAKSTAAGANLSQKRIDDFSDRLHKKFPDLTEDAAHDTEIDNWYSVEDLKSFAALDDYERARLAREAKKKAEGEKKPDDKKKNDDEEKKADDQEPPAWAKALFDEINTLKTEKKQTTIKQTLKEKLKDYSDLIEWEEWAQPDSEDKIDEFVQKVAAKHEAKQQDLITKGLVGGKPPGGGKSGGGNGKMSQDDIKAINDKLMPKN